MYNLIQWPRHSCMWHSTLYKKKKTLDACIHLWILFICIYLVAFYFPDIRLDKSSSWRSLQILFTDSDCSGQWGPMRGTRWFPSVTAIYGSLWPPSCSTRSSGMWYVQVSLFFTTMSWGVLLFHSALLDCGEGGPIRGLHGVRNIFSFAP